MLQARSGPGSGAFLGFMVFQELELIDLGACGVPAVHSVPWA